MDIHQAKAISSMCAALVCAAVLIKSDGKSGLGWFAFYLSLIW